jgi:hypothetical protein
MLIRHWTPWIDLQILTFFLLFTSFPFCPILLEEFIDLFYTVPIKLFILVEPLYHLLLPNKLSPTLAALNSRWLSDMTSEGEGSEQGGWVAHAQGLSHTCSPAVCWGYYHHTLNRVGRLALSQCCCQKTPGMAAGFCQSKDYNRDSRIHNVFSDLVPAVTYHNCPILLGTQASPDTK